MASTKKAVTPRTLLLDIETAPSLGLYFDLWKEGNIVSTIKSWYMLSFSVKWLDENKVTTVGLNDFSHFKKNKEDDSYLCRALADILAKADIVIAHNGDKFDIPKINARFVKHGIAPVQPYKTIDTRKVAKRYFAFESNRLDDLGVYLGVGKKLPTGGISLWMGCMAGDKDSWKTMKKYNAQDVVLLEKVYRVLRPWMTNHPNIGLMADRPHACPVCGTAGKLQSRGYSYTRVGKKARYQCVADNCGAWSQGETIKTEVKIR